MRSLPSSLLALTLLTSACGERGSPRVREPAEDASKPRGDEDDASTPPPDEPDEPDAGTPEDGGTARDAGGDAATGQGPYALPDGPRYYVAPSGDDAAEGSAEAPWRTIGKALARVERGTIVVREGRYAERLSIDHRGQSEADWLTLAAQPGEAVELTGAGASARGDMIRLEGASYVRVLGLRIVGDGKQEDASGIRVFGSGHHLALSHNDISQIRGESAMGITIYGKDGAGISDLVVEGNTIHDCEPAPSEALVVNGNVKRFALVGNVVRDVNNIGIDVIGGEAWLSKALPTDGLIADNRVERANSRYDGSAACIYVDGASRITIERNAVSECDFGIEVGAENPGITASDVVVRSNFVFKNYKGGIIFGGYDEKRGRVRGALFTHNSLYKNGRPGERTRFGYAGEAGGEIIVQYADDCRLTNNILYGGASAEELVGLWGSAKGLIWTHNLFFREGGRAAEAPSGAGNRTTDPGFRAPEQGDLHLSPSSPARDAAEPEQKAGALDIDGEPRAAAVPDIGADET